ncbi:hypothetical protein [Alteribacillus iranensis]|uniref:Uncharacterized protein n=1 Tax=Alteribacillus iranensis TaxID=930128 RepID=A0A1I2EMM2_9BACI|nr:hypothetical protein [Alteribacillus iranensis]SFE94105.1 hypothetical protein SAMN05192532_106118 [Alteribacillus iranensis]
MHHNQADDFNRYKAATLRPELLKKLTDLENEIQDISNEEIILIAYEEKDTDRGWDKSI